MESKKSRNPTKQAASRILGEMHEVATGLHEAGFIDLRRMREYDALCLRPVEPYSKDDIAALRNRLNISQAVLAALLNTSLSTVRQWEAGLKRPSGPSQKLLNLLGTKGIEALT